MGTKDGSTPVSKGGYNNIRIYSSSYLELNSGVELTTEESTCKNIVIDSLVGTSTEKIQLGVGSSTGSLNDRNYSTKISRNTNGDIKVYNEADLIQ